MLVEYCTVRPLKKTKTPLIVTTIVCAMCITSYLNARRQRKKANCKHIFVRIRQTTRCLHIKWLNKTKANRNNIHMKYTLIRLQIYANANRITKIKTKKWWKKSGLFFYFVFIWISKLRRAVCTVHVSYSLYALRYAESKQHHERKTADRTHQAIRWIMAYRVICNIKKIGKKK